MTRHTICESLIKIYRFKHVNSQKTQLNQKTFHNLQSHLAYWHKKLVHPLDREIYTNKESYKRLRVQIIYNIIYGSFSKYFWSLHRLVLAVDALQTCDRRQTEFQNCRQTNIYYFSQTCAYIWFILTLGHFFWKSQQ